MCGCFVDILHALNYKDDIKSFGPDGGRFFLQRAPDITGWNPLQQPWDITSYYYTLPDKALRTNTRFKKSITYILSSSQETLYCYKSNIQTDLPEKQPTRLGLRSPEQQLSSVSSGPSSTI